ncbi:MAG: hypothetical protein Q4E57_06660 [Eubacteriales bacterium]|nr:hypothetical protein [Eubacteriales bacterium]
MYTLKEQLNKEKRYLDQVIEQTSQRLINTPEGDLRVSNGRGRIRYYHKIAGDGNAIKYEYISNSNKELPMLLAQKSYDEKILAKAKNKIRLVNNMLTNYDEHEFEKIYLSEHPARRAMITPIEPTWDEFVKAWMSEPYTGKAFQEGTPLIITDRGERVRSKSEKILADYFYHNNIPYKYEKPIFLKGVGWVYPDFTLLSQKTRSEIYWEHAGMMDDPAYAQNFVRKIELYEYNGIFPGEQLILTFETDKSVLNTKTIELMVNRYL